MPVEQVLNMFQELKELLQNDVVDITFTSLSSGREYTVPCTLKESLTNSRVNQQNSHSILCYRMDTHTWEDISINSILNYEGSP
jgi:hypothetical protein